MPKPPVPFIDEVPEYEVRGDIIHITLGGDAIVAMPLRIFRLGTARAEKVIAAYERRGEVLKLRRRKGDTDDGHAA